MAGSGTVARPTGAPQALWTARRPSTRRLSTGLVRPRPAGLASAAMTMPPIDVSPPALHRVADVLSDLASDPPAVPMEVPEAGSAAAGALAELAAAAGAGLARLASDTRQAADGLRSAARAYEASDTWSARRGSR